MTIQDFMLMAESAAEEYFRNERELAVEISREEVVKANDNRAFGLRMTCKGAGAGWTVYLNDLYARYEDGADLEDMLSEAVARCEDGLRCQPPLSPEALRLDFDSIRDRLSVRLLGVMNNISYMAGRPYIDVGCGLALIAVIGCDSSRFSEWFVSVTNELLESEIGCSREELLTAAMDNTMRMEPPMLVSLSDYVYANYTGSRKVQNYLKDPVMADEKRHGSFMLTNESTFFGAAVLFYPGIMERIGEILGCGYYVLPSSIHEVMIIPDAAEPDVQDMADTVLEANATVVDRNELLSDNVFHYSTEEGVLCVVRTEQSGRAREATGRYIA